MRGGALWWVLRLMLSIDGWKHASRTAGILPVQPPLPPHPPLSSPHPTAHPTPPTHRLVEPVAAQHDLDNLRLQELGPGQQEMAATFELEALMLTGMCLDLASLAARMRDQVCVRVGGGVRVRAMCVLYCLPA